MKFLKGLGWVFIPYIMLPFQWKKISTAGKIGGSAWAIVAILIGIGGANSEPTTVEQAAPAPQTQPVSAPQPQTQPPNAPKPQTSTSPAPVPAAAKQSSTTAPAPSNAQPVSAPAPSQNKPTISKAEFDKIKNGMTYEQVVKIIGGKGEMLSESGSPGDPYYTVMYMFEGEGMPGANANFMFQGGKLQTKAQFGLK